MYSRTFWIFSFLVVVSAEKFSSFNKTRDTDLRLLCTVCVERKNVTMKEIRSDFVSEEDEKLIKLCDDACRQIATHQQLSENNCYQILRNHCFETRNMTGSSKAISFVYVGIVVASVFGAIALFALLAKWCPSCFLSNPSHTNVEIAEPDEDVDDECEDEVAKIYSRPCAPCDTCTVPVDGIISGLRHMIATAAPRRIYSEHRILSGTVQEGRINLGSNYVYDRPPPTQPSNDRPPPSQPSSTGVTICLSCGDIH
ncbi:uncharacterized protein LOC134188990 isoform X2 [Corticium candelabrum]|uniref:uncharacterized protein LOC134188990 isoform X2 n=1 Tax=Corticium candelabrum TaxID=121492 RepID=UPI002E26DF15|nr:uncharacterized protein LOC134188990 isoform X2 [Corticium candelabrum]